VSPTSAFDRLTLAFDPDLAQWRFGGRPAGPAGLAVLASDGVRLVVDATDPGWIVEVTIDLEHDDPTLAPADASRRAAAALLGPRLAALLVAQPAAIPVDLGGVDLDPDRGPARGLAGRLAVLQAVRDPSVSKWWTVEEVCLRAALAQAGLDTWAAPPADITEAAEFVRAFADPAPAGLTADQRARLLLRLRALARLVAPQQPELAGALARLEGPILVRAGDVESAFGALTADLSDPDAHRPSIDMTGRLQAASWMLLGPRGEPRGPGERDAEVPLCFNVDHDYEALPGVVADDQQIAVEWFRGRDELRARFRLAPGMPTDRLQGVWVRVHVRPSEGPPYLLDLSHATLDPDHAGYAMARLLVPSSFSSGQLLLDFTSNPSEPVLTAASRARHRAVRLALAAASGQRQRSRNAARTWHACHREWIAAGDHGRAALALRRAAGGVSDPAVSAELVQRARELLRAPDAAWAEEYLQELRDVPEPFDQEVFEPGPD
jgi:hypothetical protein